MPSAPRGCSAGDKQDRRQSGSAPADVTGCHWARLIVDDYGCRVGVDSQNVDMALTWNATHEARRFTSVFKYLICFDILVAGASNRRNLPELLCAV